MLKKLWFLCLVSCALGLDAYVLSGLLPSIAQSIGSRPEQVGLGIAIFTLAYALSTPIFGNIFQRIHTSHLLQLAVSVFIVGNILTVCASAFSVFILGRLVAGVGAGIFSPLAFATAIKLGGEENKGQAIAIVLAGLSVGTAFGVPFGLWLSQIYTWKTTILCIIGLSSVGLLALFLNRLSIPLITTRASIFNKNIINSKTIPILMVTFLTGFTSLGLYSYLGQLLFIQGLMKIDIYAMWLWGIGGCIGAFSVGKLLDNYISSQKMTILVLFLLIISFILLFSGQWQLIVLACFIWGYAGWSSIVPQQHRLTSISKIFHQNILALNSSLNYLGGALGTAVASFIAYMQWLQELPIILVLILGLTLYIHCYHRGMGVDDI
ncbi:MFS transporter [Acinetobacter nectaris]|uniref:MFS transporter n=1 Tax=Acinetobacter nectaris TaxID=1219382 RepID=UPI001F3D17E8|nr:MFS transporter [Acinetobacter nectaris]MCF8998704.1 MFS transporter [Acinetobacter nectaris]MCF9026382.1 MFS transporter [Acinetobacter nectaris]